MIVNYLRLMSRKWDVEELIELFELRDLGWSARRIAKKLGRSEAAIKSKARRDLPNTARLNRPWTHEDEQLVVELLKRGKNAGYIAKALGRSRSSIYTRISRHKL